MKKTIQFFAFFSLVLALVSCNNRKSLQSYLVETQDKAGFISVDLPTSFLELKSEDAPEDVRETLESIRKISLVALPYEGNEEAYETEKQNLKAIFKDNDDYTNLVKMKVKGMNMNIFYTGDSDAIDEVIVFGYGQKAGVGVARLLGDDMNPSKIISVANDLKLNPDKLNLEQLLNFNKASKTLDIKEQVQ